MREKNQLKFIVSGRAKSLFILFFAVLLILSGAALVNAQNRANERIRRDIRIVNNQPFPVKMPIELRGTSLNGTDWRTADGKAAQTETASGNLFFIADLPASSAKSYRLQSVSGAKENDKPLTIVPTENGISLNFANANLG